MHRLIACFLPVFSLGGGFANSATAAKPNVLFLICDDLNCDLGSYGHPQVKSPNIDRLASRGVRFEQAHCQFPLCGPSRASFMTGLYPDQDLIHRNAIRIRQTLPDVVTLSQSFRKAGYRPIRVGKIYHYNVPADIGNDGHDDPASWDYKFNPKGRDKTEEAKVETLRKGSYGGTLSWLAADGTDAEQTDGIAATEVDRLLKEHAANKKPFFMAVGFYRPHTPYVAPKAYFDMYPRDKIVVPKLPDGYLDTLPMPARVSITRKKEQVNLPDDVARKAIQAYYASITFVDAQVGRVLDSLKASGLADNTIVVFTSDHGYHMGEHGHYQKTTLFQNATNVPLIIATPNATSANQAAASPVELVDLYPTLTDLCGVTAPKILSGISLAPTLKNPAATQRRAALSQYATGYSIRTSRYRYTEWGAAGEDGAELYDVAADPTEMVNLATAANHAAKRAELSALLQQRIAAANVAPAGLTRTPLKPRGKKKKKK